MSNNYWLIGCILTDAGPLPPFSMALLRLVDSPRGFGLNQLRTMQTCPA